MKLSYNWLKQYIDFELKPEELSTVLTDIGLEVEGLQEFQSIRGGLEGVVIGEVKSCVRHPNADKLSLTRVDVGGPDLLSIVCGAPNVAEGQKVLVATVGTTLYQGEQSFEIKKTRIRGEESEGMICAEDELGLGDSHEGIMVLPDNVGVGIPAKEYYEVENDYVFEIGLTPNRVDAASHIGAARDLVAGLNRLENTKKYKLKIPDVSAFHVDNHDLDIDVIVEDPEACPRYTGITLSNIQVKESPEWLRNKLLAIGLRPINNIVDVTNYVLHETGQPLHAFDAEEIKGNRVVIKKLKEGTPFITLDEEERKLNQEDLMICNDQEGMCIAGVFGGIRSGVTEKTTRLFLESAYFDPAHIRRTSRRHTLQTDASFRFERGADPNITVYALKRAILLFQEVAGGKVSSEIKDVYPQPVEKVKVDIRYEHVDRLIGNTIDRKIMREILQDLGMEVTGESEVGLSLLIPTNKVDVTREADVIEEIIRIYGFNRIEYQKKFSTSVQVRQKPDRELYQNRISEQLTAQGFHEVINNSLTNASYYKSSGLFTEERNVRLLNALSSDLDILRQTLLFGGLEVIAYNRNRKLSDIKLYEFGNIYQKDTQKEGLNKYFEEKHLSVFSCGRIEPENWNASDRKADFYFLKGVTEKVIQRLGIQTSVNVVDTLDKALFSEAISYTIGKKQVAFVATLSGKLLSAFDIKEEVYYADINWDLALRKLSMKDISYTEVSKFPAVRRDLALLINNEITFEALREVAIKANPKLVKSVGIFDVYQGEHIPAGKKSYALSFILQDEGRTLTDKVIEKTMQRIRKELADRFDAELR